MKFKNKLLQGTLIKRYKRFFVDIKYQNKKVIAHCPNSGSMMGLLTEGNKVWFSKADNPNRKLKYTLEILGANKNMIGVNTHLTNKIVLEALENKKIKDLIKFNDIKSEVKFSDNTRFDFLISNKKEKCFLEVKNVTLVRKKAIAEFPDSITSRGSKHLKELINAKRKGYASYILYLIQRDDCKSFKIAEDIDPEYSNTLIKATKKKLNILCYDCKFSPKGIKLNQKIKLKFK